MHLVHSQEGLPSQGARPPISPSGGSPCLSSSISCLESLSAIAAQHEDWIIQQAIVLLDRRVFKAGPCLSQPAAVRDYLRLKLVAEPNEIFAAVFLDSMHQVLAYKPLFRGTINATSVYPRVVVQRVLELNAAAVVFAHQHPRVFPSRRARIAC